MKIRRIFILLIVSILFIQLAAGCSGKGPDSSVLSDTEIAALRDRYPVNAYDADIQPALSYLAKNTSSYVVAKIIGREPDSHVPGTIEDDPMVVTPPFDRAHFTIEILDTIVASDSVCGTPIVEGSQVSEGQEIVVTFTKYISVPKLEAGMVVVMPIFAAVEPRVNISYFSAANGLYYVVDEHVIAGFEELEDAQWSGQTLDNFKSEIARLKES